MKKYTRLLAEHGSKIDLESLSPDVPAYARSLFLDFIGLAAKGLSMESTRKVHGMIRRIGGSGPGTVIGCRLKPMPQYAALANAASSHSMSLDDIYTPASIHPGSAIFAAAMSASEAVKASGRRFLEGAVAGYETTLRVADAIDAKSHYAFGYHPTATCGTFGATAAVSRILGLNADSSADALGIAGSMAAGLMAFMQDGSWTKRLHPGLSAQRGIQAAYLAQEGFKGPKAVLEGKWGFLSAASNSADRECLVGGLGGRPRILDTGLKLHACCRYNQSAIDACLAIAKEYTVRAADVESIRVEIFKAAYPLVVEPWEEKMNPQTDVQAQFSLPYTVAVAIAKGRVSFEEFDRNVLEDPEVRELMNRVEVHNDPQLDPLFPKRWPTRVAIQTKDGRRLERLVDCPRGDVENPLPWEELVERFRRHTDAVFEPSRQDEIIGIIREIQDIENMDEVTELLGGSK
jgi:2-methylcitrate dehydratase PrpD